MRAEPFCTNDFLRAYFRDCGLTYDKITEGDILSLVLMLNQEIKHSNNIGETSVNSMRLSRKMVINLTPKGTIKSCYLFMSSHYFENRECISFNTDGFIGFAGWADEGNSNPIRRAFYEWCKKLKFDQNVPIEPPKELKSNENHREADLC